jgi:hypothetical protein
MIVHSATKSSESLTLTRDEMMMDSNALNEACHGLTIEDFHARMGADREEVGQLLERLDAAWMAMDAAEGQVNR